MVDHAKLRDPNAEYTMRDLSSETMGLTNSRGDARDVEITDVQTTMVDGTTRGSSSASTPTPASWAPVSPTGAAATRPSSSG